MKPTIESSWVQISAPDTKWIFFNIICCKNCVVWIEKTKSKWKRGRDGKKYCRTNRTKVRTAPIMGNKLTNRWYLPRWQKFLNCRNNGERSNGTIKWYCSTRSVISSFWSWRHLRHLSRWALLKSLILF